MGFKSVMKKVGKVALKVAPYAAMAIPGVGPMASIAISAGLNAAQKKAEGGSWKQALGSAAIGAGAAYAGGKIPGLDKITGGIGPSSKVAGEAAAKATKGQVAKKILGKVATDVVTGGKTTKEGKPDWAGGVMDRAGEIVNSRNRNQPSASNRTSTQNTGTARTVPVNAMEDSYRNPNIGSIMNQGRQQAIQNQPYRSGYSMPTGIDENEALTYTQMPQIFSSPDITNGPLNRRRMAQGR